MPDQSACPCDVTVSLAHQVSFTRFAERSRSASPSRRGPGPAACEPPPLRATRTAEENTRQSWTRQAGCDVTCVTLPTGPATLQHMSLVPRICQHLSPCGCRHGAWCNDNKGAKSSLTNYCWACAVPSMCILCLRQSLCALKHHQLFTRTCVKRSLCRHAPTLTNQIVV